MTSEDAKVGSGAPKTGNATRVVVAEDEALIRLDLVEMLTEEGYDVVGEAGDGEAAVALTTELKPDLVVMDVKMPKMDGISAAEQIATQRIAPVVMLTAFSQRELVDRARQAGAMAYVVKPFSKADMIPAIEIARARFAEIQAVEAEVSRPDRAAGVAQGGRPRQGPAADRPRADRARGLPLDPEDGDGPAASRCARSPRASSSTAPAPRRSSPLRRTERSRDHGIPAVCTRHFP